VRVHLLESVDPREVDVKPRAPPGGHTLAVDLFDLSKHVAVEGVLRNERLVDGEFIEVDELADEVLLVRRVPDLKFVGDNAVVVYLPFDVLVLQTPVAQLGVVREEVVSALAADPEVDV